MKFYNLPILILLTCLVSSVVANSEEEEDDDWFSFSSSSEENEIIPNNKSSVKKPAPKKEKQWNRAGLCDHDVITSVILKLILDAQDRIAKGDNSTGLQPLDPIYIPEIVLDGEKIGRSGGGDGGENSNSPVQGTIGWVVK